MNGCIHRNVLRVSALTTNVYTHFSTLLFKELVGVESFKPWSTALPCSARPTGTPQAKTHHTKVFQGFET